jgi:hypothetical protein
VTSTPLLESFDRQISAKLIAGLLVNPLFHANTLRIETLLQEIIVTCAGNRVPTSADLKYWLNEFPEVKRVRHLEDPVEDTFAEPIFTEWGSFRIYGGIWEDSAFYLQRVLNVVQNIPKTLGTDSLMGPIRSLLVLSEAIASRNATRINQLSPNSDKEQLNIPNRQVIEKYALSLTFSPSDLDSLGLDKSQLKTFTSKKNLNSFDADDRTSLLTTFLHAPLVQFNDDLVVIFPTALSWAIRLHCFGWLAQRKLIESFQKQFVIEYVGLIRNMRSSGRYIPYENPLRAQLKHSAYLVEYLTEFETGRYLHTVIKVSTISQFSADHIETPPSDAQELGDEIDRRISNAREKVKELPNFKEGLSLIVMCGFGQANAMGLRDHGVSWMVCPLTAEDLETIAWTGEADEKTIWRFVRHEDRLYSMGVEFINLNGLLNLYGWWVSRKHQLIPGPVQIGSQTKQIIHIPTDCIGKVRRRKRAIVDSRLVRFIDGSFKEIRRRNLSVFFKSDMARRLYHSYTDANRHRLVGCALVKRRTFWVTIKDEEKLSPQALQTVDALLEWVGRIANLANQGKIRPDAEPMLFRITNVTTQDRIPLDVVPESLPQFDDLVHYAVNHEQRTVELSLTISFFVNLRRVANTSEKALVTASLNGLFQIDGLQRNEKQIQRLVSLVVPNDDARHMHAFQAKSFREQLSFYRDDYEAIDNSDASMLRIGLGHIGSALSARLSGKSTCTDFLRKLVRAQYDLLRKDLARFNRRILIVWFFQNIEGIASDMARWNRTARAVLNLHHNQAEVYQGKAEHFYSLYAAQVASRLLIEIGCCECTATNGLEIASLDASPLMARISLIFHLGNISDGIEKEIIEPEIQVTPSGDVRTVTDFQDQVLSEMIRDAEESDMKSKSDDYDEYFINNQSTSDPNSRATFPPGFAEAFRAETTIDISDLPRFLELVEDIGANREEAVYEIRLSELTNSTKGGLLSKEKILAFVGLFSLEPRASWETLPEGYSTRDLNPWLFRRRLSLYFKPIVRLDTSSDPSMIISPGFLVDAFNYVLGLYSICGIEEERCKSAELKRWIGAERDRRGHTFSRDVSSHLKSVGFETEQEIKISSFIPSSLLDRDYGDIDVLAWSKGSKSVFIVECKNLLFAKSFKEIAEQLQDYKGKMRNGKPDSLKRHVDRIRVLQKNLSYLEKRLGIQGLEIRGCIVFSKNAPMLYQAQQQELVKFFSLDQVKSVGLVNLNSN